MNCNFLLEFKSRTMKGVLVLLFITVALGKPTGPIRDPMINEGLFEGDMVIPADFDRNAVPLDSQRWPGGVIPYVIDDSLKNILTNEILKAMSDIMKVSCIRFVPRTPQHKHYVRLFRGNGCWAVWGFANKGQQDLSLAVGCEPHATIIHELMHAIGFEHEHSRSDRDDYLIINLENVNKTQQHNFKKMRPEQHRLLSAFDFDSVMLYGQYAFSLKPGVLKSMEAKDGRFMPPTYNKPGLAKSDIYRLRILYECK